MRGFFSFTAAKKDGSGDVCISVRSDDAELMMDGDESIWLRPSVLTSQFPMEKEIERYKKIHNKFSAMQALASRLVAVQNSNYDYDDRRIAIPYKDYSWTDRVIIATISLSDVIMTAVDIDDSACRTYVVFRQALSKMGVCCYNHPKEQINTFLHLESKGGLTDPTVLQPWVPIIAKNSLYSGNEESRLGQLLTSIGSR